MFLRTRRVGQEEECPSGPSPPPYQCALCGQAGDVAVEAVTREEFRCDRCLLERTHQDCSEPTCSVCRRAAAAVEGRRWLRAMKEEPHCTGQVMVEESLENVVSINDAIDYISDISPVPYRFTVEAEELTTSEAPKLTLTPTGRSLKPTRRQLDWELAGSQRGDEEEELEPVVGEEERRRNVAESQAGGDSTREAYREGSPPAAGNEGKTQDAQEADSTGPVTDKDIAEEEKAEEESEDQGGSVGDQHSESEDFGPVSLWRQPYSRAEEAAVLDYLCRRGGYSRVKGGRLWRDMKEGGVCPGRSGQALR